MPPSSRPTSRPWRGPWSLPPRAGTESRCHRRTDYPDPREEWRAPPARSRSPATWRTGARPTRRPAGSDRRSGVIDAVFEFHPSPTTRHRLLAGGLDPDAVAALCGPRGEDLMGGIDVTSVATIDADQRSVATFAARAPAWSPASRSRRTSSTPCAAMRPAPSTTSSPTAIGSTRGRRWPVCTADQAAPHRRAFGAQPAVPPVRRGDADSGGSTPWPARRPSSATRARRRRDCARLRSTRCAAAAARTIGWGCPTRRSSRTTTSPRPAVSPRHSPRCGRSGSIPVEIEVDSLAGLTEALAAAPTRCCSTTSRRH